MLSFHYQSVSLIGGNIIFHHVHTKNAPSLSPRGALLHQPLFFLKNHSTSHFVQYRVCPRLFFCPLGSSPLATSLLSVASLTPNLSFTSSVLIRKLMPKPSRFEDSGFYSWEVDSTYTVNP